MVEPREITAADEAAIAAAIAGARAAGKGEGDYDTIAAVQAALVARGFETAEAWAVAFMRDRVRLEAAARANAISSIRPYRWNGLWVFDDERIGLVRVPFAEGDLTLIDEALAGKGLAGDNSFLMLFSAAPFGGAELKLDWVRREKMGGVYALNGREAWLSPAFLLHFEAPPPNIHVKIMPLRQQRIITADAFRRGEGSSDDMWIETSGTFDMRFEKVSWAEPELENGMVVLHVWNGGRHSGWRWWQDRWRRWLNGPQRRIKVAPDAEIAIL